MKYISIDIETTGLDPDYCQVLQIGAIADDLEAGLPIESLASLEILIRPDGPVIGEPYALALNKSLLDRLAKGEGIAQCYVFDAFREWCGTENVIAAGKNFGAFDRQFLKKLDKRFDKLFHHRSVDPAMFYFSKTDKVPPSLKVCLERCGIQDEVLHDAVSDARQVVRLVRGAK